MTTTSLYFIRHGETQWNLEQRFQGSQDSYLTEKGKAQAESAAQAVSTLSLDAIYSSPLSRAMQTANILKGQLSLPIIANHSLREINLGPWEGVTRDEVQARYPKEYQAFWAVSADYQVEGAETFANVEARMVAEVERLLQQHKGGQVLLVSHAMSILCALRFYQSGSLEGLSGELKNCQLIELRQVDDQPPVIIMEPVSSYAA